MVLKREQEPQQPLLLKQPKTKADVGDGTDSSEDSESQNLTKVFGEKL